MIPPVLAVVAVALVRRCRCVAMSDLKKTQNAAAADDVGDARARKLAVKAREARLRAAYKRVVWSMQTDDSAIEVAEQTLASLKILVTAKPKAGAKARARHVVVRLPPLEGEIHRPEVEGLSAAHSASDPSPPRAGQLVLVQLEDLPEARCS